MIPQNIFLSDAALLCGAVHYTTIVICELAGQPTVLLLSARPSQDGSIPLRHFRRAKIEFAHQHRFETDTLTKETYVPERQLYTAHHTGFIVLRAPHLPTQWAPHEQCCGKDFSWMSNRQFVDANYDAANGLSSRAWKRLLRHDARGGSRRLARPLSLCHLLDTMLSLHARPTETRKKAYTLRWHGSCHRKIASLAAK